MSTRIIPERIREAREAAGLTDEQFADALEISRQAVGSYETGASAPRGEVFSKIIAVTGQPPSFFTMQRWKSGERFRMPNWRSLKRMQRPDRLRIGRRLEWAHFISEFLAQHVELPPVCLPDISFDFESDDDERVEEIADELREFWRLGFGPLTDLAPILEYNGVILIEEYVRCEDMDAVSRWQGGRPYILYARETESSPRKLFNLAHELAHLILHTAIEVNSKNLDRMERQANRFAGAFLMPRRTFAREVANTSIDYLISLKSRWRVSVAAMVYRCKEIGILTPYQVKYIWKQMNSRGMRKKEPLDTAFGLSSPSVLASAIDMLVASRRKYPSQIAEELALNAQDIESLCAVPPGTLLNKVVPLRLIDR
jgi:Zn-dependent peptidase ImmA (M78 family)/DNA-binding XRE family transcriptional regulator